MDNPPLPYNNDSAALYNDSAALFLRIANGDEIAFSEVFHRYSPHIYPYLLKKVHSQTIAHDILQDIFFKLWLNKEALLEITHGETYLYKIAANHLHDFFRKEAREQKIKNHAKSEDPDSENLETEIWFSETRKLLAEATNRLPPRCKLIYNLRQEGHSYEQIATHLGLSLNTVKNQLVIAGKAIRAFLINNGLSILLCILKLCNSM